MTLLSGVERFDADDHVAADGALDCVPARHHLQVRPPVAGLGDVHARHGRGVIET